MTKTPDLKTKTAHKNQAVKLPFPLACKITSFVEQALNVVSINFTVKLNEKRIQTLQAINS